MPAAAPTEAERIEQILQLFAREARIEREALRLDARPEDLGVASLDLAVALFEIEDRFGVVIDPPAPGTPPPTVGELLQQVLARLPDPPAPADGR